MAYIRDGKIIIEMIDLDDMRMGVKRLYSVAYGWDVKQTEMEFQIQLPISPRYSDTPKVIPRDLAPTRVKVQRQDEGDDDGRYHAWFYNDICVYRHRL